MSSDLSDLRFGDLLTFLTVHRCGAITGAARALKVTPSQVSKAVHRLERQLGATLLSRSSRGVIVSDAGRRLIPQLEEVAARLQQMRPDEKAREELALAAPSYLNAVFLPRIAAELDRRVGARARAAAGAGARLRRRELLRRRARRRQREAAGRVGQHRRRPGAQGAVRRARGGAQARRRAPVDPKRLAELPFVTPIYNVNGQFVPADDGCPLGHIHRRLGHQSQTLVVGLDLARSTGQLIFGPALAAARARGPRRARRGARARLGRARTAHASRSTASACARGRSGRWRRWWRARVAELDG